jgi:uncharacterized YigZ family protein
MKTVAKEQIEVLEIKKSKFISVIKRIDTEQEAKEAIMECKKKYPMAKHYVYAYILDTIKRCSDDKEPSKTAGAPILQVLEKKEMNHVICIVIRYFGGILLGAPGLVRAYTKSVCNTLDKAFIVPLILYEKVKCSFSYEQIGKMDFLLKERTILEKQFLDKVYYTVLLKKKDSLLEEIKKYSSIEKST